MYWRAWLEHFFLRIDSSFNQLETFHWKNNRLQLNAVPKTSTVNYWFFFPRVSMHTERAIFKKFFRNSLNNHPNGNSIREVHAFIPSSIFIRLLFFGVIAVFSRWWCTFFFTVFLFYKLFVWLIEFHLEFDTLVRSHTHPYTNNPRT